MSALLDEFVTLLTAACAVKMKALDRPVFEALRDGDDAALLDLRQQLAALRDLPLAIVDGDRAALVAQWPAGFPALPDGFANPAPAAPAGPSYEVRCTPLPTVASSGEEGPSPAIPPALEDSVLAMRREKAAAEDEMRPAALQRQAEVKARLAKMAADEAAAPALSAAELQAMIDEAVNGAVAKALAAKE